MRAIDRFSLDYGPVQGVQGSLEACSALLERGLSSIHQEIRDAVEDLEMIRFGMLEHEQRTAAVLRLGSLREILERELRSNNISSARESGRMSSGTHSRRIFGAV